MKVESTESISKILSANDIGVTGSHQAGIAIPRQQRMLEFFPKLDTTVYNPRCSMLFRDEGDLDEWELNFIYYNGKLHGRSTRNEYRLTGLTPYFKKHKANVDDVLQLTRSSTGRFSILLVRRGLEYEGHRTYELVRRDESPSVYETIKLSGAWSARSRRS